MRIVRISLSEYLNLDKETRMEVFASEDTRYMTVHMAGGGSYRCTEEETEVLMAYVVDNLENPAVEVSE